MSAGAPPTSGRSQLGGRFDLLLPVAGCVLGFALLRALPELPYGEWLSERLRLHWTWPLLPLVMAVSFWRVGVRWHAETGRPLFAPTQSSFAVSVLVGTAAVLLAGVAAGWPLWWALAVVAVFAVTARPAVKGWFAYTEVWRVGWNEDVVDFVRGSLARDDGRALLAHTRRRLRHEHGEPPWLVWLAGRAARTRSPRLRAVYERVTKLTEAPARRQWVRGWHAWGSPHCLRVIEEHVAERRRVLLAAAEAGDPPPAGCLERYLVAGDCLAAYLRLRWADPEIAATARERLADLRREMVMLVLWFGSPDGAKLVARYLHGPGDDTGLLRHAPERCQAYRTFWGTLVPRVCAAAAGQGALAAGEEQAAVREAVAVFRPMRQQGAPAPGVDPVEVCALAWVALATRVSEVARFDVWLHVRRQQGRDVVGPPPGEDQSAAVACGRRALEELYRHWAGRLPPGWEGGIASQADRLAADSPAARRGAAAELLSGGDR